MTVIRPNSISGITSITSHQNDVAFYKSDGSGANINNISIHSPSGIITSANFKTGSSNLHSTGLTVGNNFLHSTGINVGTGATIHVPATNVLTLGTNSNERLRIDSSGRLLVGDSTATGAALVQVQKSSGDMLLVRNHATNYESLILSVASGTADIYASSGGSTSRPALRFITNDSERMRIQTNGDVLIGTDSYAYTKPLNVQGSTGAILSLANYDTTTYAADTHTGIEFRVNTGNTGNQGGSDQEGCGYHSSGRSGKAGTGGGPPGGGGSKATGNVTTT